MYVHVFVCVRVDICKCTYLCMSECLNVLLSWIDYICTVCVETCRNIYIHACTHIPGISYVCKIMGVSTCFAGGNLFCIRAFFAFAVYFMFWIILVKRCRHFGSFWSNVGQMQAFVVFVLRTCVYVMGRCGINKRALCTRSTYMSDIMSVYHVYLWVCVYVRVLCLFMHTHIYQIICPSHVHDMSYMSILMLIMNRASTSEAIPNDWFHDIRTWQGKYSGWAFVSEPSLTLITPAFSWETISEWLLVTVKTPWEWALQIERNWNKEEPKWPQKQWQEGSMDPFWSFRLVDKVTATTRPPHLPSTANNSSSNNADKNNSSKTETIHKSTCHQPCQNPLYHCSRPPFQAPWRCQLACWCKLPAWQAQFFSVLPGTKGKLHQVTGYCSELYRWTCEACLQQDPSLSLRWFYLIKSTYGDTSWGPLQEKWESTAACWSHLSSDETPPWRQSNGNPGLIATELALCMASILSRSGKLNYTSLQELNDLNSIVIHQEGWMLNDSGRTVFSKDWQLWMLSRKTCGLACHSKNSSASQGHVVSRILTAEQFQDCLNHHVYNANKYLKQCKVVVNQVVWYLHIHHQFSKGGEYAGVQYMTSLHAKVQKCHQCPTNHTRMIPLVSQTFAPMVETGQLHRQLSPQPGRLEPKVTLVVELVLAYPSHHKAIKTSPGTCPKHDSFI